MEEGWGPHSMIFLEGIPPLPNGPKAADWLPGFAGFSWLAYGGHHQLAISNAPSATNTEEAATGRFFQQILDLDSCDREWVRTVGWSPQVPSLGILAARAGNNIHVFGPKTLSRLQGPLSLPELPLAWERWEVLRHSFQVSTFSWTFSGDGLIAVGSEVMMWQHQEGNYREWICLWRMQLEHPHHLCAASFSVKGFVATAAGVPSYGEGLALHTNLEDKEQSSLNERATIWLWEGGSEVEEVELMHPQQVLMLQWRPSKVVLGGAEQDSGQSHRPILLTTCTDGAVRLWLEVDSGRSRLDRAAGRESADKRSKSAFFVSAVIEVNRSLCGQLGQNIFVTWATDILVKAFGATSKNIETFKQKDIAPCEWLVGLGPNGSISLWSLHCLDDVSPPRCPRVLLWEHGFNLLPDHLDPSFVKCVVGRPEGTLAEPPSSLDIFEILQGGQFRWLRIWPPVSAIGRGGSKAAVINFGAPSSFLPGPVSTLSLGKKGIWSVASADLHLHAHQGEVFSLAVHPSISTRLAASLDRTGTVVVWVLSCCYEPQFEIENFLAPFWKLGGQLPGHRTQREGRMDILAWAPVVFPGGETCLLVANLEGASCFLTSKEAIALKVKPEILRVAFEHICTLPWSVSYGQGLEGIYTVPTPRAREDNCCHSRCTVLGIGNNGTFIVAWQLLFAVYADDDIAGKRCGHTLGLEECHKRISLKRVPANSGLPRVLCVDWHVLGSLKLEIAQRVISVASPAPQGVFVDANVENTSVRKIRTCHVVTGCADGIVRFWRVASERSYFNDENENPCFQCVALLKAADEQITSISLASNSGRVATSSMLTLQKWHFVCIWQAESCSKYGRYRLEDKLACHSQIYALTWLEQGNGLSTLAVALREEIKVYVQCRTTSVHSIENQKSRSGRWICIASTLLDCKPDSIAWGPCATLLVASGGQIWASGLRTSHQSKHIPCDKQVSKLVSTCSSSSPSLASYRGIHSHKKLKEVLMRASSCNTLLAVSREDVQLKMVSDTLGSLSYGFQTAGAPLPDYHPTKIMWYLSKGEEEYARTCIRHLLHHFIANMSGLVNVCAQSSVTSPSFHEHKVTLLNLRDLQKEEAFLAVAESSNSRYEVHTRMNTSDLSSTHKYAFLDTCPFLEDCWERAEEVSLHGYSNHTSEDNHIKTGGRENLTKYELDTVLNAIEMCNKVPQLTDAEKLQLLAVIDTLIEVDGIDRNTRRALLDQPGHRFWLAARYSHHKHLRTKGSSLDVSCPVIDSKAMAWALHSESKDAIFDLCFCEQPSWSDMRALGLGFWYTDPSLLRKRMEKVARAQFLAQRDPKECMLLYLALDRRNVLTGLFKLSRNEQDKHLYEFLVRDFKDEKHRGAALKNAYVLMGKHRYELAASFFVLGGDVASAISVCTKNLGDCQLGLVICRLLEGLGSPIGVEVITKQLLPIARLAGDYWLASLLQWLVGCQLEAVQELTRSQAVQSKSFEDPISLDKEEAGLFGPTDTSGTLLFDPDIGDFCTMLTSKPSLQSGALAAESSRALRHAILLSNCALSRSSLPLQALEQLKLHSNRTSSKLNYTSSVDRIEGGAHRVVKFDLDEHLSISDIVSRANVGTGWMLRDSLGSVEDAARENLALQWAAQLLQDHPFWLTGILTWSQLIKSLQLQVQPGDSVTNNAKHGLATYESSNADTAFGTMYDLIKKADKLLDDNFCILATKFSVDLYHIFFELGSLSGNLHRPYTLCRLTSALESASMNASKYPSFASRTALPLVALRCMKAVCKDSPWILARVVLVCGGHVAPIQRDRGQQRADISFEQLVESVRGQILGGGVLSCPQLQTLIQYALEIMLLASALETENNAHEAPSDLTSIINEKKIREVTIMLAYVLTVAGAWLGRCARALLLLVGPTVQDTSTAPEQVLMQFDAAALSSTADVGQQKGIAEAATPATSSAIHIVEDDVWRVLGVALWSHILSYCKKQLSRSANKSFYSSYGRVSQTHSPAQTPPVSPFGSQSSLRAPSSSPDSRTRFNPVGWVLQPSSPTSEAQAMMRSVGTSAGGDCHELLSSDDGNIRTGDTGQTFGSGSDLLPESTDPGMPLLSSLACIAAGLRKQLASHVGHTLDNTPSDPLVIWLWGRPLGFTPEHSVISSVSEQFISMPSLEVADNGASMELWKLLVVKEKLISAVGLEGVVGPKITAYNNRKPTVSEKDSPASGSAAGTSTNLGSSSVLRDSGKPPGKIIADTTRDHPAMEISATGVLEGLVGNLRSLEGKGSFAFLPPEEILHLSGELFEAICINSCDPEQVAIASTHKGIIYLDLKTHGTYSQCKDNLWGEADWPKNGWAGYVSTPSPAVAALSLGSGSNLGVRLGVGGSAASLGSVVKPGKDIGRGVGFGVPGYGGMGAWGWGWEEWEGGVVDPPATVENVHTKAMAAHPLRPLFLVGSDNTHVYLWEFGKTSATATYGVLPGTNVPPLYVIPSVSAAKFDRSGHRFASAALDGSVSIWQLEVGGRSNVCPTDSQPCFSRLASDVAFVGASGSILATTGATQNGENLVIWDTLAPPNASRAVSCHEGGARCISMFDNGVGGSSSVPLLVTGGKSGDIAVHDFRYIAGGKTRRHPAASRDPLNSPTTFSPSKLGETAKRKQGQQGTAGMTWYIPHAHSGGVARVVTLPGTSLFLSASKDGDVKLWDVNTCEMVGNWTKVHERHMFLRHDSTGFGAIHAAVTDLQVLDVGFVTCGADGIVKLFRHEFSGHGGYGA